ncbi:hypothetical protein POM88_040480 [Heracleum sosnowskyi]|uniref:Uncharacterized protein n=1 Tax=Heracleum sosnowskyi TaxID=360622 RepID=A0AAD8HEM1_9APIA|nr:hypothetical protein POM88_040480 [Heracleum sosnowskyi]
MYLFLDQVPIPTCRSCIRPLNAWYPHQNGILIWYWNDPSVLQKLGEAMGLPVSGDAVASAETSGQDESDEVGNEGESIVHNTASVGDVEFDVLCAQLLYNLV